MNLINSNGCEKETNIETSTCPNCDCPRKNNINKNSIIVIIIVISAILTVLIYLLGIAISNSNYISKYKGGDNNSSIVGTWQAKWGKTQLFLYKDYSCEYTGRIRIDTDKCYYKYNDHQITIYYVNVKKRSAIKIKSDISYNNGILLIPDVENTTLMIFNKIN